MYAFIYTSFRYTHSKLDDRQSNLVLLSLDVSRRLVERGLSKRAAYYVIKIVKICIEYSKINFFKQVGEYIIVVWHWPSKKRARLRVTSQNYYMWIKTATRIDKIILVYDTLINIFMKKEYIVIRYLYFKLLFIV